MSKAYDVAMAVFDRASQISIANGYSTDIGITGYRGKKYLDPESLPCFVLVEDANEGTSRQKNISLTTTEYVLEGYATCDPDHPNDVGHLIVADLQRAIFSSDLTLGQLVTDIAWKGREIEPRDEGSNLVAGRIKFALTYVESLTASSGPILPSLPVNVVAPAISGSAVVDSLLSCTRGTWTGYPAPTFTRQWQANGSNIPGEIGTTYLTVAGDSGKQIRCVWTGTNPQGHADANSNAVTIA